MNNYYNYLKISNNVSFTYLIIVAKFQINSPGRVKQALLQKILFISISGLEDTNVRLPF